MSLEAELQGLADRLRPVDARSAERLEDLALAVSPGGDAGAWSGVDVFRAIDPAGIVKSLQSAPLADERLAALERWRNALALAPLLLTWVGLMIAATGYQAALRADASLLDQPFLLLWEEGFLGHLPRLLAPLGWLTFSRVVLADAALLVALLLLTWKIHDELSMASSRRAARAQELEAQLQQACWRAALALGERASPFALVTRFREASDALLDELYAERARLDQIRDERERELADLRGVAGGLQQGAADLLRSGGAMRSAIDALLQASTALDDRLAALTRQQSQLEAGLSAVGKEVAGAGARQQAAGDQLDAAARLLTDTADASVAAIGSLADVVTQLRLELAELRQQLLWQTSDASRGVAPLPATTPSAGPGNPINGHAS
jgi:hypothetical protein